MARAAAVLALTLLCVPGATCADGVAVTARLDRGRQATWVCEPHVDSSGLWGLRCEDLDVLFDDDLALAASDRAAPRWWMVPTYSPPMDAEFARRLVRATLCGGAACRVSLTLDDAPPQFRRQ